MTYEKHPVPKDTESNEYATPRHITRSLARELPTEGDRFDLDPASGAEDDPHAWHRYTKADDGLTSDWFGWVFCNPPWSSPANDGRMKEAWLRRTVNYVENDSIEGAVVLLPDDVSTAWFAEYGATADYVTFCGRIQFGNVGTTPSFGVMLLTWGDVPKSFVRTLADMGPTFRGPKLPGAQTGIKEYVND